MEIIERYASFVERASRSYCVVKGIPTQVSGGLLAEEFILDKIKDADRADGVWKWVRDRCATVEACYPAAKGDVQRAINSGDPIDVSSIKADQRLAKSLPPPAPRGRFEKIYAGFHLSAYEGSLRYLSVIETDLQFAKNDRELKRKVLKWQSVERKNTLDGLPEEITAKCSPTDASGVKTSIVRGTTDENRYEIYITCRPDFDKGKKWVWIKAVRPIPPTEPARAELGYIGVLGGKLDLQLTHIDKGDSDFDKDPF